MLSSKERELAPTAALNQGLPCLDWYLMPESFSAPLIKSAIDEYRLEPGQTVLDPFSGTGTTVLTAVLHGLNGVGIEVNPFLCFAARIKTHFDYDLPALERDLEALLACAAPQLIELSLNPPLFPHHTAVKESPIAYQAVTPPDMPRLYRWMSPRVVDKVMVLKGCMQGIENQRHRDLARLALAAILRPVSNMKLTPHAFGSRVKKEDAPVYDVFSAKVRKMYADLETLAGWERSFGEAAILERDVRTVADAGHPLLPVDLAVTSPPYLNNLDYTMQTRMELFFLDFVHDMAGLRKLRKRMVVSDAKAMYKEIKDHTLVETFPSIQSVVAQLEEKHKDKNWGWNYAFMTAQHFGGMLRMLQSVQPLLKPGGRFWLVLGESSHSGVFVPVPKIVGELAQAMGYELEEMRVLRKRRSSSHKFELCESTVVLKKPA
jgi:DNA modification methylase